MKNSCKRIQRAITLGRKREWKNYISIKYKHNTIKGKKMSISVINTSLFRFIINEHLNTKMVTDPKIWK
jgi:hypothetical protein